MKRAKVRRKSHAARNFAIVVSLVAVAIAAVVLSGALSPPPTFVVLIHVYDQAYGTPQTINASAFINGVAVTVSGPRSFTATVNGVLLPEQIGSFPQGPYQITASKPGYETANLTYAAGPDCKDRDLLGACHVWIAMKRSGVLES